jgi:hypothetical protein
MAESRGSNTDAVETLHRRFYEGKPERLANLAEMRANEEIARKIRTRRAKARLTQAQLAPFRCPKSGYEFFGISQDGAQHWREVRSRYQLPGGNLRERAPGHWAEESRIRRRCVTSQSGAGRPVSAVFDHLDHD